MKQLSIALLLMSYSLLSAQDKSETQLFPVVKDGKYGYINIKGELAVPYMYDDAHYYFEGLAAVKQGTKYGFINPNNKMIIEPQFDTVKRFSEGVCAVGTIELEIGLQWGFIDKKGKTLNIGLPTIGYVTNFSNNRSMVAETGSADYFLISKQGLRYNLPSSYGFFEDENIYFNEGFLKVQKVLSMGAYQEVFVDTNCRLIPELQTTHANMSNVEQGLIAFLDNGKYGFIDTRAQVVIKPQYDTVRSFSEGLAACFIRDSESLTADGGQYGFIDKAGKWVIKPQTMKCYSFHNGYARVELNGKYGFINTSGSLVIPAEYDEAYDFFRGLAFVKKEGHWEYINTLGKRVWWESF